MYNYKNRPFTTKDRDNDKSPDNCAVLRRSGWWHQGCTHANLNGQYYGNKQQDNNNAIYWRKWRDNIDSMKRVEMKIKLN